MIPDSEIFEEFFQFYWLVNAVSKAAPPKPPEALPGAAQTSWNWAVNALREPS